MTPESVAMIVVTIDTAYGATTTTQRIEAYALALDDLPCDDPAEFVAQVIRTHDRCPTPATLRRLILSAQGMLAPDEDEAFTAAVSGQTTPFHPAVRDAVAAMGGSYSMRMGDLAVVRPQFRDLYRATRARYDQEILEATQADRPVLGVVHAAELEAGDD